MVINSVLNCIKSGLNCALNCTESWLNSNKSVPTERLFRGYLFQIASMGVTNATKPEQLCCNKVLRGGVSALLDGPLGLAVK